MTNKYSIVAVKVKGLSESKTLSLLEDLFCNAGYTVSIRNMKGEEYDDLSGIIEVK